MSANHNITVDDRSCVAPEEGTDAAATDAAAAVTTGVVAITSTKQQIAFVTLGGDAVFQ